jgi:hypothetical protein
MRFPVIFTRGKGAGAPTPTLGSGDTTPTVSSKYIDYVDPSSGKGDNVLHHKLQRPMNRVAVGYWYTGVGTAADLPVTIWVWDAASEHWYEAASGTLKNGQLTYLKCASLCDPPQVQANLGQPQHGVDVLVIISDNSSGDGTYTFVVGPDSAFF